MTQFYKLFNGGCGCAKCEADDAQSADTKIVNDYDTKIVNDYEGDDDEEVENTGYRSAMSAMRNSRLATLSENVFGTEDDPNSLEGLAEVGKKIKEKKIHQGTGAVMVNAGTSEGAKKGWEARRSGGETVVTVKGEDDAEKTKNLKGALKEIGQSDANYEWHKGEPLYHGNPTSGFFSKQNVHFKDDGGASLPTASPGPSAVQVGTAEDRAAMDARVRSPQFRKMMERRRKAGARWHLTHENRSVADLFLNSQPCGDSHIPDGHQCRIGDGSSPTYQSEPKTTANSDAEQKHEERYIATTVLEQIRATDRSALMAWGTRGQTIMPAGSTPDGGYQRGGVQFRVNGGKLGHGIVRVRLMANDTYTVEAGKVRMGQWKEKGKRDGVYADSLMETIDHMIERDRPGMANRYHAALEAMMNAGTSEGAKKGWESRARGVADSATGKNVSGEHNLEEKKWQRIDHAGGETHVVRSSSGRGGVHIDDVGGDKTQYHSFGTRNDGSQFKSTHADMDSAKKATEQRLVISRPITDKQALERGVVTRSSHFSGNNYQADGQGEKRFKTAGAALAAHDEWRRKKESGSSDNAK